MKKYKYIVEGEIEQKFINELKGDFLTEGTVLVFNVTQGILSSLTLNSIKNNTTVILIFDTDRGGHQKVLENIRVLKKCRNVDDIWLIPQVKNFEDELLASTNITKIRDFCGSRSNSDFKKDFMKITNLREKLINNEFKIQEIWVKKAINDFNQFHNHSLNIKKPIRRR